MSSLPHGGSTSEVEVTNISSHGLWLLAHGRELFLPYEEFPWFREATVAAVTNVEEPSPDHYYWPELDVDLSRDIIEHPERYTLRNGVNRGSDA